MKQIITFLCIAMFSFTYANSTLNNNAPPSPSTVSASGNFYSAGAQVTYQVYSSRSTDKIDINYVSGAFVTGYVVFNNNTNSVDVTVFFKQCRNQSISSSMQFGYDKITIDPRDPRDKDPNVYGGALSKSVTIVANPNAAPIGVPSVTQGTTGFYAQEFYTFTASTAGATSYNWEVEGGTITGPTNGDTINVIANASACGTYPGHPNKLKARAQGVNVCETSVFSSWSERYVGAPVYVGDISGPASVGLYYGDYSGYTSSAYVPSSAIHEYVWSVSGPFQLGSNGTNQNFVFVNTYSQSGSGTLYVYVRNICGQTITKSKNIHVGNGMPGGGWGRFAGGDRIGSDTAWVDVKETKVVSNQSELKLIVPNFEEKGIQIYIYNLRGEVIENIKPTSLEVHLDRSKFKDGIYIIKTVSKKEMSTSKFKVSN